jgi:hypothetical protein
MRLLRPGLKPFVGETKEQFDKRYSDLRRDREDRLEANRRDSEITSQKTTNRIAIWAIAIAAMVALAIAWVQHVDSIHASQENHHHGSGARPAHP